MSKKKAFSGNTMTLKDFHGGSIPSDLPLPSAPGVTDRVSDRPGYDHRPLPWGVNPTGRTDQRSRLSSSSSSSARHFEDTTSFLSHAAPIGRNFDEDERKPLDGMPPGPRPTVGDDGGIWASELKHHHNHQPLFSADGRLSSQHQQVQDVGSHGNGVTSASAWSMRKESVNASQPLQSASSASAGASKLTHASAIEKVTSGRWHSRLQSTYHQAAYTEETNRGLNATGYKCDEKHIGAIAVGERRRYERHLPNSSNQEIYGKGKDILLDTQLPGIHCSSDEKETNVPMHNGGAFQRGHDEGTVATADTQYSLLQQAFERPKLKLLPRSKPSETSDQPHGAHKQALSQGHQKPVGHSHSEFIIEGHSNAQFPVQLAVNESGSQMVERPKLNLKPRSQPIKQVEEIADRDRTAVYGGARPRELVLKERRVDEVLVVNSYDFGQGSSDRSKINHPVHKSEGVSGSARYNLPTVLDPRSGRKEQVDDLQRKSCWRNESWKSATSVEKQQERRPSPEIWRKPVEDSPKPPSPPPLEKGIRFGKAASAAEVAQAFSRSCSVAPNKSPQFSGQRQVPFSRLTGGGGNNGQRAQQINGY